MGCWSKKKERRRKDVCDLLMLRCACPGGCVLNDLERLERFIATDRKSYSNQGAIT